MSKVRGECRAILNRCTTLACHLKMRITREVLNREYPVLGKRKYVGRNKPVVDRTRTLLCPSKRETPKGMPIHNTLESVKPNI